MDDEQRTIEKQYPRQGSALSFGANEGAGATASFFVAFKCGSEKVMCVQQVLATNVPSPIPLLPPWKMLTIRGCPWRLSMQPGRNNPTQAYSHLSIIDNFHSLLP
ncbi:hypothetical protein FOWG_06871 [Fusarium oxysporum f. sp. lycopersici MN25]|nr:hypothetical protein FOWG_06871 [Fusarium oxysporum f. sp. lycopersici MN25]EWZ91194.1 hypothetical protein FOWG_06871 [Fusarium oxysporum f. sp. lycopersici MN25]EWZ91195.1 hypothetical protein FOWG_06871 [Fusarium oxysporum f. sp. lycopersici MN25]